MTSRDPQVVTTVDLPSGKVLEVVHPAAGRPYTRLRPNAPQEHDLSVCERCDSNLVEPTDWSAAGAGRWRVSLRCPDCEHWREGVFSQEEVDRFDEKLDDGTAAVVSDLKKLEHANFVADVERFVGALRSGAILPEDF